MASIICAKNSHTFCDLCAKQGITSKLVQFHVNLEEAILLCTNQGCLYPFGSGDITSFIVQKTRSKETSFTGMESKFTKPVCSPGCEGGNTRLNKPRKGNQNCLKITSATDLEKQRKHLTGCIEGDISNCTISLDMENMESYPKTDKKCSLLHSVRKDRGFLRRSKKMIFEPYTPKRKRFCNFLLSRDNVCDNVCAQLPVDLEQDYKELTKDEEKFVIDIVLNKC